MSIKIISWNVNGLRSVINKKVFYEFVEKENPDVLCLQEIKANSQQLEINLKGYQQFWNPAKRKGYSGTAIFSKVSPVNVFNNFVEDFDYPANLEDEFGNVLEEGRLITFELEDFWLLNVYTPNSKPDLQRLKFRHEVWDPLFLKYLKFLEASKPVVVCGDFNVAHKEIDLARPDSNHKSAGFTDEEREGFDKFIKNNFVDTFRIFNKEGGNYTWWSNFAKSRERNVGWRIDYVLVSNSLKSRVKEAFILPEVYGSDHCPVGVIID
ncbi:MAG: exodeoxyribonuclease III [Candidatus Dojkabacteria bacterium]|nr:MAG: exodeoxyribonuclease III [Candidatus Dojkabacteria bacterium]